LGLFSANPVYLIARKCPVSGSCYAFENKLVTLLPVKLKKPVKKQRYFYYYYIENKNTTWIEKRIGKDIWKNLYQFPLAETPIELNDAEVASLRPWFLEGMSLI
jgi:A/G-specific adenine glycosylase